MKINDRFFTDETRENASALHKLVWATVRKKFPRWSFIQEQPILVDGTTLFVDIYCASPIKLAIEIMGEQHVKFNKHFHSTISDFKKSQARDMAKKKWLLDNYFTYVTFFTNEKIHEVDIVNRIFDAMRGDREDG